MVPHQELNQSTEGTEYYKHRETVAVCHVFSVEDLTVIIDLESV